MTLAQAVSTPPRKPLRLWPGITATVLGMLVMLLLPVLAPSRGMFSVLSLAVAGLLVIVWWLFFSRAPWIERIGALALVAIAAVAARFFVHESLGAMFYIVGVPVLLFALVVWAAVTRGFETEVRRAWLIPAIALGGLLVTATRFEGASPSEGLDFGWRWTPTVEDRLLVKATDAEAVDGAPSGTEPSAAETAPASAEPAELTGAAELSASAPPAGASRQEPEWPGFRGSHRNGIVRGVQIATDWSSTPPVELWRREVGPGWSSFAIDGDRFYTQEQLGEEELVTCYTLETGEPIWTHRDAARFYEAAGGPGPRATPQLHDGRLYTVGATGIVNALDARDGSVVWSRNVATDAAKKVPDWGIAGSPLVVGDALIVAAAGKPVSYDLATGEPRWVGPKGAGYSSPHLATLDGVEQIVILNGIGVVGVDPRDGKELWEHEWSGDGILQPAVLDDGSVLLSGVGSGMGGGDPGLRRVGVHRTPGDGSPERGAGGWAVEERWTSSGLKPFFNDFVVHEGHAYGFDGALLSSIDLADGARKWKGGRYGNGQLLVLADQDLLLVLSEKGELALVGATPGQFTEQARFKALAGKTWNHPALAGDILLVRNSAEMAAFRLTLASSSR